MRICQVMLAPRFGGAERHFVDLSLALAERGHQVLAICQRRAAAVGELGAARNLEVAQVFVAGAWDPFAVRSFRARMLDFQPQVAVAHLARAAHLAGKALAGSGIPLAAKTHNYVDLKYYRHVRVLIPTTADQRRYLGEQGVADERIEQIPNFVSRHPVPEVPGILAPPHLVAYGRMVRKKGFDVLLEALALLKNAGKPVHLRLGGDGPEMSRLRQLADSLGIAGLVRFEGWCADVDRLLRGAALFVLPSLDEPFGIAVLEAMAAGVPVVCTATQGPREILDERSGWLVPPGDAAALADTIGMALADPAARTGKAAHALERIRREYAEDVVVPRIEGLYRRLAGLGQQAVSL